MRSLETKKNNGHYMAQALIDGHYIIVSGTYGELKKYFIEENGMVKMNKKFEQEMKAAAENKKQVVVDNYELIVKTIENSEYFKTYDREKLQDLDWKIEDLQNTVGANIQSQVENCRELRDSLNKENDENKAMLMKDLKGFDYYAINYLFYKLAFIKKLGENTKAYKMMVLKIKQDFKITGSGLSKYIQIHVENGTIFLTHRNGVLIKEEAFTFEEIENDTAATIY